MSIDSTTFSVGSALIAINKIHPQPKSTLLFHTHTNIQTHWDRNHPQALEKSKNQQRITPWQYLLPSLKVISWLTSPFADLVPTFSICCCRQGHSSKNGKRPKAIPPYKSGPPDQVIPIDQYLSCHLYPRPFEKKVHKQLYSLFYR